MFKVNRGTVAAVVAEFLGTAILAMSALILGQTTAVSYFIATSVAAAAIAAYMLFSNVSGAHLNPAVTFGMWTARRLGTLRGICYVAAQMLGGVAAWQLFQYLTNHTLTARTTTFSTPVWLAELLGAGVVCMAYVAAQGRKNENSFYSGVMIGAAYFAGIIIAATASAGYINPAIALASRSWSSAYVLGPLAGGLIGVNLYAYLFGDGGGWSNMKASSVVVRRKAVRSGSKKKK